VLDYLGPIQALLVPLQISIAGAQLPESFFPHNVGDRWDYAYWNGGFYTYYSLVLTRDSIGIDSSHNLFYNNSNIPTYTIDTLHNLFWNLTPSCNYLLYKLNADSGQMWENSTCGERWAWVASADSGVVFSRRAVIKVFQYGPAPDSGPNPYFLVERRLANGFGLIYEWQEPGVFSSLIGCVIAGDTFGTLLAVAPTSEGLPDVFTLSQNYPNPFNAETNVEFKLPNTEYVSLKVFDILGREIVTLYEKRLPSGTYRVRWDASGLPSGVYLLRLSAAQGIQTRKMILMK